MFFSSTRKKNMGRGQVLLLLGALALVFSGLASYQDSRDVSGARHSGMSLTVLATAVVGFVSCLAGSLEAIPELRSTSGLKHLNSITRDEFLDRPNFRLYNHRAAWLQRVAQGE